MLSSIRNVKFYKNALEYSVYHRCLCYFLNQGIYSPVPDLSFPPAPYKGRAKEESSITCMRMLRTNQSAINGPNHAACVIVSRNAFFSSRSERKHFL